MTLLKHIGEIPKPALRNNGDGMMGFEENKRIAKEYRSRRVTVTVGGKLCHFRAKFEYYWCQYLEFLKRGEDIRDWFFEPKVFYFPNEKTAPVNYLPDFEIIDKNGLEYWQECKGDHDGKTNEKFRRMAKHYPGIVMELVLQRIPSKRIFRPPGLKMKDIQDKRYKRRLLKVNRRATAMRYCRRIIDASEIFKQVRGVINFNILN